MFVHSGFADFRVFIEMIIMITVKIMLQTVTVDWCQPACQTNKQILQTKND